MTAYIDKSLPPLPTVRHKSCELLLPEGSSTLRCGACTLYRNGLRASVKRAKSQDRSQLTDPSSHVNYRFIRTPEKDSRLHELHRRDRAIKKRLFRLRNKLDDITMKFGVLVDNHMTSDLVEIMKTHKDQVLSHHSENSFPHIFWQQQFEAAQKSPKGMRWHPLMIRWCIYLRHKSSGAYDLLRESGVVSLPSQRTLRDYTHYIPPSTGFSSEVDQQLIAAAQIEKLEDWQKCVIVILI